MSITETEDEETKETATILPFRVISGGRDNTYNWLRDLPNNSVFLARPRKVDGRDNDGFMLALFVKNRNIGESIAVELKTMHGEPMYVHSQLFSEQMEPVAGHEGEDDNNI